MSKMGMIPEQAGSMDMGGEPPEGMEHFYNQSVQEEPSDDGASDDMENAGDSGGTVDESEAGTGQDAGAVEHQNTVKDEPPVKQPEAKADDPGQQEQEEEFVPLTDAELDLLYEEDPRAAREYERQMHQRELSGLKKGLDEINAERAAAAEMAQVDQIERDFDAREGKGEFNKISKQLGDAKYLEALFKDNPEISHLIQPLIAAGDRIGVTRVMLREANLYNRNVAGRRRERSIPSSTGGNVGTRASVKIDSIADALAAAKAELT